jgi:hypothetical protein
MVSNCLLLTVLQTVSPRHFELNILVVHLVTILTATSGALLRYRCYQKLEVLTAPLLGMFKQFYTLYRCTIFAPDTKISIMLLFTYTPLHYFSTISSVIACIVGAVLIRQQRRR